MTHASLFSGIGGAELAASWCGWENKFHCDINEFGNKVIRYHFPNSKEYGDITKTDFREWRGQIDVLTGGFPCQPFSVAGKRKGKEDDRYLWPEMLRAIREIQPTWVVGENVGGIVSMVQPGTEIEMGGETSLFEEDYYTQEEQEYVIETICKSLENEGYPVQPILIPACSVGAPHRRDRVWFIANTNRKGLQGCEKSKYIEKRWKKQNKQPSGLFQPSWKEFPTQSPICSGDDGLSDRLTVLPFLRGETNP